MGTVAYVCCNVVAMQKRKTRAWLYCRLLVAATNVGIIDVAAAEKRYMEYLLKSWYFRIDGGELRPLFANWYVGVEEEADES